MDYYIILLRIVHILGGVFWVGATWMVASFLEPTATALGPDGGKFVEYMAGRQRFAAIAGAAGALRQGGRIMAVLLVVTLLGMATARYL